MEETRKPSIGQDNAIVSKDLRAIYIKPNGNPEHNPGTQEKTSPGPILS